MLLNQSYHSLSLDINEQYIDLLSSFILDVTNAAIEISNEKIILRTPKSCDELIEKIKIYIQNLSEYFETDIEYNIDVTKEKNRDWIDNFQKSVKQIEIGRFCIRADWYKKTSNLIDVVINPSFAFGTGHHFTTNSCIIFIGKYVKQNDTVLDVGCGSGILSIASHKMGGIVDLCDTDKEAISNAISNTNINKCNIRDYWVGTISHSSKSYNVILANIVSDVIILIYKDLISHLMIDGILILSGILKKYEQRVLSKFVNFTLVEKKEDDHWVTLVLRKNNE